MSPFRETPCLALDVERMDANIERMEQRCRELAVAFRPHVKTAKSPEIVGRIPSARRHGITVSTLLEAEVFAAAGYRDILYAVCLAPGKIERALRLAGRGVVLRVAVDHPDAAAAIARATATRPGPPLSVLLEVDCGEHRCGVPADPDRVLPIARAIAAAPGLELSGCYTHGGHSYAAVDLEGVRSVATQERDAVVATAEILEADGLPCPIRSVGSTPTLTHARDLAGVTEARAGVFVFHDQHQVGLGSCQPDDIALTVAASVVAVHDDHAVIDAGGLALSKDHSTASLGPDGDVGYGLVRSADGEPLPHLRVERVFQEHGILVFHGGRRPAVGDVVRVVPNHACMTAAAYGSYWVRSGPSWQAKFHRVNGW